VRRSQTFDSATKALFLASSDWAVSLKGSRCLWASYNLQDGFMSFFDSYGNSLGGADWEDQVGAQIMFAA
jgi:hypothetical protein